MDRFDRLTVEEVAEKTGWHPEAITTLCREGAIDSFFYTDKDGSRYMVEAGEIHRWQTKGPRPRMGYDAAIALLKQRKYVRRATWPTDALVWHGPGFLDPIQEEAIIISFFDDFRSGEWDFYRYEPSAEDLAATDWVECAIIT